MREILFRGKTFNDEWVEGALVKWSKAHSIIRKYGSDTIGLYEYSVVPETVGQYTGLTDKNGKKIFEGDIVFYECSDVVAVVKFGEYQDFDSTKKAYGYFVEYLEDGKIVQENMDSREKDDEYGCEVIGNIHDNPELLGGDDN